MDRGGEAVWLGEVNLLRGVEVVAPRNFFLGSALQRPFGLCYKANISTATS